MGKRKRKSKKQQSHSPSSPPNTTTMQGGSRQSKRGRTLPPDKSISTSPSRPGQDIPQLDPCPPQVNQKLWNRFYEPLVLLSAYGKSQGLHVKSKEALSEGFLDGGSKTLRKKLLDGLAYICDYSAGGDTVAAVAIQDGPQLIYWVTANTSQASKLKPFLSEILQILGQLYNANEEKVSILELEISDRAIVFCAQKLRHYRSVLRDIVKTHLPKLDGQGTEEENGLKEWLISLSKTDLDPISFSRLCYDARDSDFLKALKTRAGESGIHTDQDSYRTRYARIRHLIGRLGSHIKAARVLVEAGRHYPKLFMDYSIEFAAHATSFSPPSYREKSSINGIINRMVRDPQSCQYYQRELRSQVEKFHLMLEQRIRDEYKSPKFKLRVHAELILLDLFHRKSLQFLDGIRYIGVSKPSCFLCYRYLQAHPLQVQTSGCSNNLYLQWQPPYIQENTPTLVKEQEDILNAMIKGIRLFVLDKIVPEYQGIKAHPDSTTGLETSIYADDVRAAFLTDASRNSRGATPILDQANEGSYGLDEMLSMSDGGMGDLPYESPSLHIAETSERFDEESDGDCEDGGVSLL